MDADREPAAQPPDLRFCRRHTPASLPHPMDHAQSARAQLGSGTARGPRRGLEIAGRELYRETRESLHKDAAEGRVKPRRLKPAEAQAFWESGEPEQFELAGDNGDRLDYYVRHRGEVWVYSRPIGVALGTLTNEYASARQALQTSEGRDFRRGFSRTLLLVAAALWQEC